MQQALQDVNPLFGLYDKDGLLRYLGRDEEGCLAYAELFNMKSFECSFFPIPKTNLVTIKGQEKRSRQVVNNN